MDTLCRMYIYPMAILLMVWVCVIPSFCLVNNDTSYLLYIILTFLESGWGALETRHTCTCTPSPVHNSLLCIYTINVYTDMCTMLSHSVCVCVCVCLGLNYVSSGDDNVAITPGQLKTVEKLKVKHK